MRDCQPTPQFLVQVDQPPKAPTSQSTGHAATLQALTCSMAPQGLPPWRAGLTTRRFWYWMPEPQVAVHVVALVHLLMTQSTGQPCRLQDLVAESAPASHFLPPYAASMSMPRDLVAKPPPQSLEQAPHVVHAP